PASAKPLARVAHGSAEDVDQAVQAARRAQAGWWTIGGLERAKVLYALARLVQKHSRLLAVLETMDNGKPIRETRDVDIRLVARHFYHHAGWAQLLDTEFGDHEPLGVLGQVIPRNFPLLVLAWKIAPALGAGNTVVLKPALGGESPFIVFEDADLDAAVEGAVDAIWFNQGQVCCAGSRLLVQESVAEKLHAKLRARMETLRVGDPLDKATDVGAIVSP